MGLAFGRAKRRDTLVVRIWSVIALEKKGPEVKVWYVELGIERFCRHLDTGLVIGMSRRSKMLDADSDAEEEEKKENERETEKKAWRLGCCTYYYLCRGCDPDGLPGIIPGDKPEIPRL